MPATLELLLASVLCAGDECSIFCALCLRWRREQRFCCVSSGGNVDLGRLKDLPAHDVHAFIRTVTVRVQVQAERIELALDRARLLRWFDGKQQDEDRSRSRDPSESEPDPVVISIPVRLRRAGKEMRLVVDDGSELPLPDPALIRLVIRAHGIRDQLLHDRSLTLDEIAKSNGFVPSYATRLFRLTLLAPDIVAAVLCGRQPPDLTARKLMDDTRLPLDWNEQRRALGFVQSH